MSSQAVFKAISDQTRRDIIGLLASSDMSLNEVVSNFTMTRPAVAKHLGVLRESGLVNVTARGRERIHSLCPEALKTVAEWLNYYSRFWDDKLDSLKLAVEADDE